MQTATSAVQQLLDAAQENIRLQEKQLRLLRGIAAGLAGLVLVLLISGFVLVGRVQRTLEDAHLSEVMQTVSELDLPALNDAILSLKDAASTLDSENVQQSLQQLGDAAQKMNEVSQSLENFSSQFSGLLGR